MHDIPGSLPALQESKSFVLTEPQKEDIDESGNEEQEKKKRRGRRSEPTAGKALAEVPVSTKRQRTRGKGKGAKQLYKIALTAFESPEELIEKIETLGGSVDEAVGAATTHLCTDTVRRTVKFLCALNRGIPIVCSQWLEESSRANQWLPTDGFVLRDPPNEEKFGFSVADSLKIAQERGRGLFADWTFTVFPGTTPGADEYRLILASAGATVISSSTRSQVHNAVAICPDSLKSTAKKKLLQLGWIICRSETILNAIVSQVLPLELTAD